MIQAAIFDMDGIIIDSEPIQMVAINQVMAQWNLHVAEEDFLPMMGRRLSDDYGIFISLYRRNRGHPVIIHPAYYNGILELPLEKRLRQLRLNYVSDILKIPVCSC